MASTLVTGAPLTDCSLTLNTAAILLLHDTLMTHCSLPTNHQAAWRVATQHFVAAAAVSPIQLSTAVHLASAIGQCCSFSQTLQQQLIHVLENSSILTVMMTALQCSVDAADHQNIAAVVKVVSSLVQLLPPEPTPAAKHALAVLLNDSQHRSCLIDAAASSSEAAAAVAALLVAAASCSLPAAAIMHDLIPGFCSSSSAASAATPPYRPADHAVISSQALLAGRAGRCQRIRTAWLTVGLQPLLLQIQQQLQQQPQQQVQQQQQQPQQQQQQQQLPKSAPVPHDHHTSSNALKPAPQHRHYSPSNASSTSGFQQLWLLLCAAIRVIDGVMLDDAQINALGLIFKAPAVHQAVQAVLLSGGSNCHCTADVHDVHLQQAGQAVQQPHSSSSSTNSSSSSTNESTQGPCGPSPSGGAVESPTACAAAAASAKASIPSGSTSNDPSSSTCSSSSTSSSLRAPALQMLSIVAAHSASLAHQCFNIVAPILPQVLLAVEDTCRCQTSAPTAAAGAAAAAHNAAARTAVLQLWQQILAKGGSSFPASLHNLLQHWLPTAAHILAAAAPTASATAAAAPAPAAATVGAAAAAAAAPAPAAAAGEPQDRNAEQMRLASATAAAPAPAAAAVLASAGSEPQDRKHHSMCLASATAAAFVPLAGQLQASWRPLLCSNGPTGMTNLLTPLVLALVRLVEAAAAQARAGAGVAPAAAAMSAAPAAMSSSAAAATKPAAAALTRGSSPAGFATSSSQCDEVVCGWVLLLALWLLQSWVAAQQQQQLSSRQAAAAPSAGAATAARGATPAASILATAATGATSTPAHLTTKTAVSISTPAASILPISNRLLPSNPLWQQMLQAVAGLVAADGSSSSDTLQLRCQAKALDLARVLLACRPGSSCTACPAGGCGTSGNTSANTSGRQYSCPAGGCGTPHNTSAHPPPTEQPLHPAPAAAQAQAEASSLCQLLAAVGQLFARSPQDPINLIHRGLLQTACKLTVELAHQIIPFAAPVTGTQAPAAAAAAAAAVAGEEAPVTKPAAADTTAWVTPVTGSLEAPAAAAAAAVQEENPAADTAAWVAPDAAPRPVAATTLTTAHQHQQQQQQRVMFQCVCQHLQALQQDLSTRKMARSSSRVDLLSAVEEALDILRALRVGV